MISKRVKLFVDTVHVLRLSFSQKIARILQAAATFALRRVRSPSRSFLHTRSSQAAARLHSREVSPQFAAVVFCTRVVSALLDQ